jgi:hypothetical protein
MELTSCAAGRWREGRQDSEEATGRRRTSAVSCAAGRHVDRAARRHETTEAMGEPPPAAGEMAVWIAMRLELRESCQ